MRQPILILSPSGLRTLLPCLCAQVAAVCVQNNFILNITVLRYYMLATRSPQCDCMDPASAVHTLTALADILRATGFSHVEMLPDVLEFIGSVARTAANSTTSVVGPGVHCLSILSQVAQDNGYQAQANKVLQIVLMNAYAGSLPGEIPLTTATDRIHAKVTAGVLEGGWAWGESVGMTGG